MDRPSGEATASATGAGGSLRPQAVPVEPDAEALEAAFQAHLAKRDQRARGNPMYSTSNSVIGHVPPGAKHKLAVPKFGASCKFSDGWVGGSSKSEGLDTSLSKSRVHKAYDGLL